MALATRNRNRNRLWASPVQAAEAESDDMGEALTPTLYVLGDDVATEDANLTAIPDLTFAVEANSDYVVEGVVPFTAAGTTVGAGFSLGGPDGYVFGGNAMQAVDGTSGFYGNFSYARPGDNNVSPNGYGTTETPLDILGCIRTGETAGEGSVQVRRESTSNITVKAGAFVKVRKTTGLDLVTTQIDTDDASNWTNVTSHTLLPNTTYLIQGVVITGSEVNGVGPQFRWSGIPDGADPFIVHICSHSNTGAALYWIDRTSNGEHNLNTGVSSTLDTVRMYFLLRTGDSGGTLILQVQSETQDSQISVMTGSFTEARDVTGLVEVLSSNSESTVNDEYTTAFSADVEASKAYHVQCVGSITANVFSTGASMRWSEAPSGSVFMGTLGALRSGATAYWHAVRRDDTHVNATNGSTTDEPMWAQGVLVNGENAGSLLLQHKLGDGETGTARIMADTWLLVEECPIAA